MLVETGFRWPIYRTCDIFLSDRDRTFPNKCAFGVGDSIPHYVTVTPVSVTRWDELRKWKYRVRIQNPEEIPRRVEEMR